MDRVKKCQPCVTGMRIRNLVPDIRIGVLQSSPNFHQLHIGGYVLHVPSSPFGHFSG